MDVMAEDLYVAYYDKVCAYVGGKVAHQQDREDLVAVIFEKVYSKRHTFDETKASISTWIYTIARNTVTDYFRGQRSNLEFVDTLQWEDVPEEDGDAALEKLADALQTLQEKERDLILLHYYKGLTLKDVAQMMQMSYINAKVIHKKALTALRAYYTAL